MIKKHLIGFLLLSLLLLSVAAGSLWYLAGTPAGTQWLAKKVAGASGDTLGWDQLEGTLLRSLNIRGLRLDVPGMTLDIDSLQLNWRPALLAAGTLQVDEITATGIRLALTDSGAPDSPSAPFDPADLDLPLDAVLEALELRDIEVIVEGGVPQLIDAVTLTASLRDHRMTLQLLQVRAAEGELVATGHLGLTGAMPLGVDLQWDWRLSGSALGGHLEATGDAEALELKHRGRGDMPVDLDGSVLSVLAQPRWEFELNWPAMDIPADPSPLSLQPGRIRTEGKLDNYRVASEGRLVVPGMESLDWTLTAAGSTQGLQLEPLTVISGPYELALSGALGWEGPMGANLEYRLIAEQLASVNSQLPPRLDAMGALVALFEDDTLTLERLELALKQSPLRLDMAATIQLPAAGEPIIDGKLQWHSLSWPIALDPADADVASPEGRVLLSGTAEDWIVSLDAQTAGREVPAGEWQGRGTGDRTELRLEYLNGALLDGGVSLSGQLGWGAEPRWNLAATGKGLNTAKWQPETPGQLAFDFRSQGVVDAETGPRGTFALGRLVGELSGIPVSMTGNGAVDGDTVQLEAMAVESGDNHFSASGELDSQRLALEWSLRAQDPGLLVPGAVGVLRGSGQVQGSPASPVLLADMAGQDLQFDQQQLSRLAVRLRAGLAAEAPLLVDIELGPVAQGEDTLLESVRLTANGTTARHQLDLAVEAASEQVFGRLDGGLDMESSTWRGQLTTLTVSSVAYGNWATVKATPLTVSPEQAALGDICLRGEATGSGETAVPAASACAAGTWSPADGTFVRASLESFSLARLLPELSGDLSGGMKGALAQDGAMTGTARFDVSPGDMRVATSQGQQRLSHGGGQLALTVGPDGFNADLDFKPLQDGEIRVDLRLPELNSLPLADEQPLAGRIRANLPDLSGLQAWVPDLEAVVGRLEADYRVAGELQQPDIEGELTLSDGAALVPVAGLNLRDIRLRLGNDPSQAGQMLLSGGLLSGEGRLDVSGRLSPNKNAFALAVTGNAVDVFDTRDARVLVSPDLNLQWSDELLRLRGKVVVPEARITPKLGLSSGSAPTEASAAGDDQVQADVPEVLVPSADVVVLGRTHDTVAPVDPALPFQLDSQIELVFGEKVMVNALGLVGRIAGKIAFINQPQQSSPVPIADGRLSIEEGSFRAFGQDLQIEKGQVIYREAPVTEPEVNLRAVRWIDSDPLVSAAGVQVTGPLDDPVLELFSRPQLDPTEIQSYLLTGQPASGGDSVLSIGTYLYTKLYVGYGYNLLAETSEFNSLYTITPRYGFETSVGEADNAIGVTITYEH